QDRTTLTALPPGQQASQNQIGGTCFGGDARIQLTYAGQGSQLPFTLGRDGVEWIEGVPATGTAGSHQVTHLASGETANFAVQPGVVTRLLLRVEAALGVPSGTAAEGSQPGGSQPGGSQPGGTTGVNPLDLIGMLVTDVLVTDTLNYADAGENMAG